MIYITRHRNKMLPSNFKVLENQEISRKKIKIARNDTPRLPLKS